MKRISLFILSVIFIMTMSTGAFAVVYGQGGWEKYGYSEATAWEIDSAAVLAKVRDDINSGKINYLAYYKLTKDIDLTDSIYRDWKPIGGTHDSVYAVPQNPFIGVFDGNGHTIKVNIFRMISRNELYTGLFGYVFAGSSRIGGTIKNLSITGTVEVIMRSDIQKVFAGGIVAFISGGSIENCKFDGTVSVSNQTTFANNSYAGGIAAYAGYSYEIFSIKNCKVGSQSDTTISAYSQTTSNWEYAGGIVGYLDDNNYGGRYSELSGNYSRVRLEAGNKGGTYGGRGRGEGIVENNIEVDPDAEPEPEDIEISGTLPKGVMNAKYSGSLKVSGGTAPYRWSVSSGFLPDGLQINANTGKITGTILEAGNFNFTVKVRDTNGQSAVKKFTMKVTQTTIAASIPATIVRGKSYTWTPKATGGTSAYKWTISKGSLPTGMKINASTGKITGKPTKAGTFNFTVKVTDKNKIAATKAFTVKVTQTTITLTVPATIVRGKSYTWTPKASGGTSAYTWSKSAGTLPDGMSINASTGKITGKPTKAGTFKFTIKATDKNKIAATKAFTVKVTQTTVTATIPATIKRGTSYTWTPKATGGTSAYTWTISKGSLPTGMKINASTGKITGKPTKTGTFSFTVKAKDKNGIAGTKAFTVKVTEATATTKSQTVNSKTTADFETGTSSTQSLKASVPVTLQTGTLTAQGNGTITLAATLSVESDDVVEAYDGKDSDLVKVKANTELTFIIGEWGVDVSELTVYVDDKPVEGLTVEDGRFTLTPEMVQGDFKVSVKAQSEGVELESEEVYIISE